MSGQGVTGASGQPLAVRALARPVILAFLLVLVAVLFTQTGGYDAMGSVQSRLAHQAMVYVVVGGWLLLALVSPRWRPRSPLLPALAVAAGAYVLSTLASASPRLSLEPGLAGLAFILLYLLVATLLSDHWFRRSVAIVLIVAVAGVAFAYLAEVAFEWAVFYRLVGRVVLPPLRPSWTDLWFGSPNLVATFLNMLAPLAVVLLYERLRRLWPTVILALASAAAVFLTGSRGGYLGAVIGALVLVLLLLARSGWRRTIAQVGSAVRARRGFALLVLVALAGAVVLTPVVLYRFAQGGDQLRFDLWRTAWTIFLEHPVLGAGPGTWVQLKIAANPPGVHNLVVAHAHDLYVQALAELGIVGLGALGLLSAAVVRRLLPSALARGPRVEAIPVAVGLAAFLGQSLVDNLVNLPYVGLMLVILVAWVDGGLLAAEPEDAPTIPNRRTTASGTRRAIVAAFAVAMVAAVPTLVRIDEAAAAQADGDALVHSDPARALAAYDRAVAIDPEFTLYQLEDAAALAQVGRLAEARTELAKAVEVDKTGINLISLASLDVAAGDPAAARTHIREANERTGDEVAVVLNSGLLSERLGDREAAKNFLAVTLLARPAAAALPLFADPARLVPKREVMARAREWGGPLVGALILAYGGDPQGARTELEALQPSHERDLYLAATYWLGGDLEGAVVRLQSMLRRDALDYEAAGWLAGILRAAGDPRAGVYLRWARLVQADVALGIAGSVTAKLAGPDETWFALPAQYPWAVYVRQFSGNVLAPGLTMIGTP